MKVAVLFTGGKDSTYAAYRAKKDCLDVRCLLTMAPENPESWMFHSVNINMTKYQAAAIGVEQTIKPTTGEKERELEDLKEAIFSLKKDVDGVVNGGIASTYQRSRIDLICKEAGLASISPLWGRDPIELLREMREAGLRTIITSVAAEGFDEGWLGREMDEGCIQDLAKLQRKYGVSPSGEGGEYESFVVDAPFFKKRIELAEVEKIWKGTNGYLLIKKTKIVEKLT